MKVKIQEKKLWTQNVISRSAIVEMRTPFLAVNLQCVVTRRVASLQQKIPDWLEMVEIINDPEVAEESRFPKAFFREMSRTHLGGGMLAVAADVCNLATPLDQRRGTVRKMCKQLGWPIPDKGLANTEPPVAVVRILKFSQNHI